VESNNSVILSNYTSSDGQGLSDFSITPRSYAFFNTQFTSTCLANGRLRPLAVAYQFGRASPVPAMVNYLSALCRHSSLRPWSRWWTPTSGLLWFTGTASRWLSPVHRWLESSDVRVPVVNELRRRDWFTGSLLILVAHIHDSDRNLLPTSKQCTSYLQSFWEIFRPDSTRPFAASKCPPAAPLLYHI
jgi:hypothetical protein